MITLSQDFLPNPCSSKPTWPQDRDVSDRTTSKDFPSTSNTDLNTTESLAIFVSSFAAGIVSRTPLIYSVGKRARKRGAGCVRSGRGDMHRCQTYFGGKIVRFCPRFKNCVTGSISDSFRVLPQIRNSSLRKQSSFFASGPSGV